MKKSFLPLAAAALGLGFASCNSDSTPVDGGFGAFYPSGSYVIRTDGTKYTLPPFDEGNPELNRYFFFFQGEIPEGTPAGRGPGVTIPVPSLYDATAFPTFVPVIKDQAQHDDPLIGMAKLSNATNPIIETAMNFLICYPQFFVFKENAKNNATYAQPDFDLEVDPTPVPGAQNDTINVRLKFFNNRAEDEKITLTDAFMNAESIEGPSFYAFDLDEAPVSFPPKDGAGKNITYIIKMTYRSYEWNGYDAVDEEKVYTRTLTCKWTPGDPYALNDVIR